MIYLRAEKIKSLLENDISPLIDIEVFESISSTNDYLKKYDDNFPIRICLAEHQSGGKGRLNRAWHSPFGKNIYFSCRYPFRKDISELDGLSLVSGLAIVKTLEKYCAGKTIAIKWPNDILEKNKKLAGILTEVYPQRRNFPRSRIESGMTAEELAAGAYTGYVGTASDDGKKAENISTAKGIVSKTQGACSAIIGIGINVNMEEADQKAITQVWTSLKKINGGDIDRNQLTAVLINHLINNIRQFEEKGFQHFVDEWNHYSCLSNEFITLKSAGKEFSGKVKGVNRKGQLLLELGDGAIQSFSSGDTTTKL